MEGFRMLGACLLTHLIPQSRFDYPEVYRVGQPMLAKATYIASVVFNGVPYSECISGLSFRVGSIMISQCNIHATIRNC